jgi:hypothetical protein
MVNQLQTDRPSKELSAAALQDILEKTVHICGKLKTARVGGFSPGPS